jgi:hypothetical protein
MLGRPKGSEDERTVRATPNSDTSDSSPDHNEAPPLVGEPVGPIPTQLNFDEDDSNIVQPSAALAVVASQPRSTPPPVPQQSQPQLGATPPAAQANQHVQAWQPPPVPGQRADDDNVQDAAQPQAAPARRMITIPEILRAHSNGLAELPCYDPARPLDAEEALCCFRQHDTNTFVNARACLEFMPRSFSNALRRDADGVVVAYSAMSVNPYVFVKLRAARAAKHKHDMAQLMGCTTLHQPPRMVPQSNRFSIETLLAPVSVRTVYQHVYGPVPLLKKNDITGIVVMASGLAYGVLALPHDDTATAKLERLKQQGVLVFPSAYRFKYEDDGRWATIATGYITNAQRMKAAAILVGMKYQVAIVDYDLRVRAPAPFTWEEKVKVFNALTGLASSVFTDKAPTGYKPVHRERLSEIVGRVKEQRAAQKKAKEPFKKPGLVVAEVRVAPGLDRLNTPTGKELLENLKKQLPFVNGAYVVTADGDDEFQRIYVPRSATADREAARKLQQQKWFWSETREGGLLEVRLAQGEHWTQEPAAPAQQL